MITWMQHHKKWLIVTIWISTIAFVGAGFVGWGAYGSGSNNGVMAKVGHEDVYYSLFTQEYNSMYAQYKKQLGDQFNEEVAKQIRLKEEAFKRLVRKTLFLNYVKDLGFRVEDEEIAKEIISIEAFYGEDGKFSKEKYLKYLSQISKTPASFEQEVAKSMLINKFQQTLYIPAAKEEVDLLSSVYFVRDDISISILKKSDFISKPNEKTLKAYYEQIKENLKSPYSVEVKVSYVKIDPNDELASKKEALKKYLAIKKGKSDFETTARYFANDKKISKEVFNKIASSKNKVLKPIKIGEQFAVIKLIKLAPPEVLDYEVVKNVVKGRYLAQSIKSKMDKKIQELSNDFKGVNIGYVTRGKAKSIKGLSEQESKTLIDNIFQSSSRIGFVTMSDKSVVYKINKIETTAYNNDDKRFDDLKQKLENIKNVNVFNAVVAKLKQTYKTTTYITK